MDQSLGKSFRNDFPNCWKNQPTTTNLSSLAEIAIISIKKYLNVTQSVGYRCVGIFYTNFNLFLGAKWKTICRKHLGRAKFG